MEQSLSLIVSLNTTDNQGSAGGKLPPIHWEDKFDRPVAHVFYGIFLGLSVLMVLFSIATFFWYRAYRNNSSMTLIGL